jgi:hypothetical protein
LGLLLGGVGEHDATLGDLLTLQGLDDDTVGQGTQIHAGNLLMGFWAAGHGL